MLTPEQELMAEDLYLYTVTTQDLYNMRPPETVGKGGWLGYTTKALRWYEKEIGSKPEMSHSYVLMAAASLIEDHYKNSGSE